MKSFKSHFVFSRNQQNGIFILVAIILLLQLLYFLNPFSSEDLPNIEDQRLVEEMQRAVDSLKLEAAQKDEMPVTPFNPNFISDYKGYLLGMTDAEIDRLHAYRAKNLWVNSAEEFQEVTMVSDSLLQHLAPVFKFPKFREKTSSGNKVSKKGFSALLSKADLNTATAQELQKVYGIGEKLSARIINYRKSLNGFRGTEQLQDVYGLTPEVIENVLLQFEIRDVSSEKLDINAASMLQLTDLPYFNYEIARSLIKYREQVGRINTFEELKEIPHFPFEKLNRIELYLALDKDN